MSLLSTTIQSETTVISNLTREWSDTRFHKLLLAIYSVVLVGGVVGMVLIMYILKSNLRSLTTIAVLNLVFTHLIFLLTVPFRIYYYATGEWTLGRWSCKIVSIMIHVHLYISFLLYVTILVMRLSMFYRKAEQIQFHQKLHGLFVSTAVWVVILVLVPCVTYFIYGKTLHEHKTNGSQDTKCFQFGDNIQQFKGLNYTASVGIILVSVVLAALQSNAVVVLFRRHGKKSKSLQDFWAQLKSLCFALIMLFCFVPYMTFRLHYIAHLDKEHINELFLSFTTLTCLDMLTFAGKGSCIMC